ncbi:Uncharacterised protein [Budvicia aquatica]|uniref:Uncharacterized protein n=1 Tax=Budvicia aquatica TaxID=82979 RepID=A0A484Z9U4_9GAMM|nr:Uncharacterised protein [Budvicia aquatica]
MANLTFLLSLLLSIKTHVVRPVHTLKSIVTEMAQLLTDLSLVAIVLALVSSILGAFQNSTIYHEDNYTGKLFF